jgi:hypothetical protein
MTSKLLMGDENFQYGFSFAVDADQVVIRGLTESRDNHCGSSADSKVNPL